MRGVTHPIALEDWLQDLQHQQLPAAALRRSRMEPLPAHVGLWLDRCLVEPNIPDKRDPHVGRTFLYRVAEEAFRLGESASPAMVHYQDIFKRWERTLRQPAPGVVRRVYRMQASSRILLHPATQETVTEGGLLLHHTYGVPYIPGSALRGAARAWAVGRGLEDPPPGIEKRVDGLTWMDHLFGLQRDEDKESLKEIKERKVADERPDMSGIFDFVDALLVPELPPGSKGAFSPLALDVVNPHYGDYYTKKNRPPPLETSDPVPTHVLTIAPKTTFLLAVETRDAMGGIFEKWLDWMLVHLLDPALREMGIGARTTSGYGRLEIVGLDFKKGAPSPGKAAETGPTRGLAWVKYDKGSGTLGAFFREENARGEMRGPGVKEMVEGLSETSRTKLMKGKEVRLYVAWEAVGNARRIVRIAEE